MIEVEGKSSEWKKQQTGIRQGSPLSPYLLLLIMTVMFHDIHKDEQMNSDLDQNRVSGALFNEILYADDTIIHSTDSETLEYLVRKIEIEGAKDGLKLNKKKCEHLCIRATVKRLEEFWKHSNCDLRFKLLVYDATIRAKLMYGLEAVQLNVDMLGHPGECKGKLNVFSQKSIDKFSKSPQPMGSLSKADTPLTLTPGSTN